MRRAAKVDANHAVIRKAFLSLGAFVVDASRVGEGFPDLVVAFRGQWLMVEVKDGSKSPSRRVLTERQSEFHAVAKSKGCVVHVVSSEQDAFELLNRIRAEWLEESWR